MTEYYQKGDPTLSPIGRQYNSPAPQGYPVDENRPMQAMPAPPSPAYQPRQAAVVTSNTWGDNIRVGKWDADLCGCFTHVVPNCLMATFCPCVTIAQIAHRINVLSYAITLSVFGIVILGLWIFQGVVSYRFAYLADGSDVYCDYDYYGYYYYYDCYYRSRRFGTAATILSVLETLAWLAVFLFIWQLRTKIRERFQIPGDGCGDCLISLCCPCCSIAQLATHVKSYKPNNCDFAPPDMLSAYPAGAATDYA